LLRSLALVCANFCQSAAWGRIASAVLANIIVAGLAGVLAPVLIGRMVIDPVFSLSIFVMVVTGSIGVLAFFGLATLAGLTS
jgi:magnesium transporter